MLDRQQINLYQPIAEQGGRDFSAKAAGLAVLTVFVSMLGIWGYGTWQVAHVQALVQTLEQQQKQQQDALAQIASMHAARANPEQLQAQIKELTAELSTRHRALMLLRNGAAGRTVGFSPSLTALARGHVDGLWIQHLLLSGTVGRMTLEGVAMDADLVPVYLQGLGKDPVLAGARFDDLVIEQPPRTSRQENESQPTHPPARRDGLRFRAESSVLQRTAHSGGTS